MQTDAVASTKPVASQASGLLIRSYHAALSSRGVLQEVAGRLSREDAALLLSPPPLRTWTDRQWFLRFYSSVQLTMGRQGCRELGLEAARQIIGTYLEPVVRTLTTLFGFTPGGLLPRLAQLTPLVVRGMEYEYVSRGEHSGIARFRFTEPFPDASYAAWEGALMYTYELCGIEGTVERVVMFERGCVGEIAMRWGPAAGQSSRFRASAAAPRSGCPRLRSSAEMRPSRLRTASPSLYRLCQFGSFFAGRQSRSFRHRRQCLSLAECDNGFGVATLPCAETSFCK